MKSKIIVTGGAGYIGSHTVVELLNAGYHPVIVDDFRNSKPFILNQIEKITPIAFTHYPLDCTNYKEMKIVFEKEENIQGVIHFAAYKSVGESVKKPLDYYHNNVNSLLVILKLMDEFKIKNFVFSSSCTVYGNPDSAEVTENTPIRQAQSPYANTKIVGEQIITDAARAQPHLSSAILRYFNPVGAHPTALIGELPHGVPNNLLPYLTQTVAGIREVLTVFGNDYNTPDGTCIRDYIHVVDLAQSHVKALDWLIRQKNGTVEAFNIGTGKGQSVLEVISNFEQATEQSVNFKFGERREGDIEQIYANAHKANHLLKWSAKYDIKDALKHAWKWEKNLDTLNK